MEGSLPRSAGSLLFRLGCAGVLLAAGLAPAWAAPRKLDPTAAERLERRQAVKSGRLSLPLPGTPDTEKPITRLAAHGVHLGARLMVRVFKAESELEVWVERDGAYTPFATYPICYWSGTLGPKLREGDRQAPEGFYTITPAQLHHGGRWRRSLNLGYPNVFDRVNKRSGSVILVHGGCDSVGCFAMTDAVNAEIYDLVSAALRMGAHHVPVHVFPFRMTTANMAARAAGPWDDFWGDLKLGYDSFERTRLPPRITVCGKRYRILDAPPGEAAAQGVSLCAEDVAAGADPQPPKKGKAVMTAAAEPARCDAARPSCRRWMALRDRRSASRVTARHNRPSRASSAVN